MPVRIGAVDEDATCAGKSIAGAMHPFSEDLTKGCQFFAQLAQTSTQAEEIRYANTACIFIAASAIEAKVNEWISISQILGGEGKIPEDFWKSLVSLQRNLRFEDKWNLIASLHNGKLWDRGQDPFQSFDIIVSLRNELIHYKGQFLGRDETPNKKIKDLMRRFGVKSHATFIEDEVSTWVEDLLKVKELGGWICSKIKSFCNDAYSLLLGGT